MGRTSTKPLVNRLLNGKLDKILADYRDEGLTIDEIPAALAAEHGIQISRSTAGRWVSEAEA